MRSEGYVSVWVGTETKPDVLEAILRAGYTSDGDWIAPPFAEAFGVGYFNDATREAEVLSSPTSSISEVLQGFSYDTTIIEHLAEQGARTLDAPASAAILLYDILLTESPRTATVGGSEWILVGSVPYR